LWANLNIKLIEGNSFSIEKIPRNMSGRKDKYLSIQCHLVMMYLKGRETIIVLTQRAEPENKASLSLASTFNKLKKLHLSH